MNIVKKTFIALCTIAVCARAYEQPPPLGVYPKRHTQFDGVTFEDTVTYLILNQDE